MTLDTYHEPVVPYHIDLAVSAAVFCTQPHVVLHKYGEI